MCGGKQNHRNAIVCGSDDPNAWTSGGGRGNDLDLVTHEIAHLVEWASNRIVESPAFRLWGDSKWAEIFIYDVYRGLGRTADVTRWYNNLVGNSDNYPRKSPGSFWFRDWFYPIYQAHGQARVRQMANYGEFVHFWSGAAGVALKARFQAAFGWTAAWESEYRQAQRDFPRIKYSHMGD
ncbi:hypothetical protein BV898_12785 [Hypsibius exemplaris]|uniref:Uncharacterized protein n=1 Tax=Hypsibius exemplaris TaxID=2072580 RepID=A0A1W0WCQ2_HYPEX|nr:hypothetical protein BV898_12785 [Hypsibius exemplaris]